MTADYRKLFGQSWATEEFMKQFGDPEYVKDLLLARRDFLRSRRREELAVRRIYEMAAEQIAKDITKLKPTTGELTRRYLLALEKALNEQAHAIDQSLQDLTKRSMKNAVEQGGRPLDNQLRRAIKESGVNLDVVVLQRGFAEVNTAAVEALWARTYRGLRVSDRIWKISQRAKNGIRNLVQVGVAAGRTTEEIAKDLKRYVKTNSRTLAEDYPKMMRRVGKRIPNDLCYEALRLVRTEKAKAYNEGVYSRGQASPSYKGVKWMLSDAHVIEDICDTLAEQDLYDMGKGVYPQGQEPVVPHPNCLCFVVPVVEDTDSFVDSLIKWQQDPSSQPNIESWYTNVYIPMER